MDTEIEERNIPLEEALMAMMTGLNKVHNNPDVATKPDWLGRVLATSSDDLTTNTVTVPMVHEASALIEVSIARLEIEQEESTKKRTEAELKIIADEDRKQNLIKLKEGLLACSEEILEQRRSLL